MPTIATNFFKDLTQVEIEEIERAGGDFGKIEIHEYVQKGLGQEGIIKLIFEGFVFVNFIRDALLWDSFKLLLKTVFLIMAKKEKKMGEIQVWLQDTTNSAPINIGFSIKNEDEISDLMVGLREKLTVSVFTDNKEKEQGKVIWMGYDRVNKVWTIQIL